MNPRPQTRNQVRARNAILPGKQLLISYGDSSRAIAPGRQLPMSNGDYSDAELLAAFGFVETVRDSTKRCPAGQFKCRPNPANWVAVGGVVLQVLEEHEGTRDMSTERIEARKAALEGSGLLCDLRVTADDPLPPALWTAVKV